jgi:hypothetical protein
MIEPARHAMGVDWPGWQYSARLARCALTIHLPD